MRSSRTGMSARSFDTDHGDVELTFTCRIPSGTELLGCDGVERVGVVAHEPSTEAISLDCSVDVSSSIAVIDACMRYGLSISWERRGIVIYDISLGRAVTRGIWGEY